MEDNQEKSQNSNESTENISKDETVINKTPKDKVDSENLQLLNTNNESQKNKYNNNDRKIRKKPNLSESKEEIYITL